jgi:hypothetical protein
MADYRCAIESFIPEVDVLVLVTSYESPLTDDEIRICSRIQYSWARSSE